MIDWTSLLSTQKNVKKVKKFATGNTTGREFYSQFSNTSAGGEARTLLRTHGVTYGRRLARKALKRRGLTTQEITRMNNFLTFEGNLTKDPEFKTIKEDRELAVFRMAINERISKDYEETLYIDVNAWGYQAAYCKNVDLSKGDRVTVRGRLQDRSWTDKEGNKRVQFVVVPNNFSKIVRPPKTETTHSSETSSAATEEVAEVF